MKESGFQRSGFLLIVLFMFFAATAQGADRYAVTQEETKDGAVYSVITLENDYLRVAVIPELGSKITSIYHKKLGWEYLDRSGKPYRARTYDMPFGDTETDGFDECFPSISRTAFPDYPWKEIVIPDHGEVCMVPARFRIDISAGSISIVTTTNGVRFPYKFERTLSLEGESVVLDYHVQNLSAYGIPYLYAAHPLFRPEPGTRIELPPGTTVSGGGEESWPMRMNRFTKAREDRSVLQPASVKQMTKLFTGRLTEGWAAAYFPDGKFVQVEFPVDKLPYLGLWFNEGGLWDLYRFAFEPTTATTDDLKSAFEHGQAVILPPYKKDEWTVTYSFGKK